MKTSFNDHSRPAGRGFSLIITVAMMILLTLLAVGLMNLATISLRSSGAGNAQAEARANARLALMLALGDLQRNMGPDQRVSARASLVHGEQGERNVAGAWKSWRWDPEEGGAPDYSEKEGLFQGWMMSGDPTATARVATAGSANANSVLLLDPATHGSAGADDTTELRATRVNVPLDGEGRRIGSFAYAVTDESLKAAINLPDIAPQGNAEILARRTAPGRFRPETLVPGLDPNTLGDPQKLVSLQSAAVAAGEGSTDGILGQEQAITSQSLGLLTDVVDGGVKVDLSNVFEGSADPSELTGSETLYFTREDGALSWNYLKNHYEQYKVLTKAATGAPEFTVPALQPRGSGFDKFPEREELLPVIAKLQVIFSLVSHYPIWDRPNYFNQNGIPKGFQNYAVPHLVYDPVVTLYNPYDVALTLANLRVRIWDPPVVFGFQKGDGAAKHWLRPEFATGAYHGLARFQIANERNPNARKFFNLYLRRSNPSSGAPVSGNFRLEPGEVKVFSPYVEATRSWGADGHPAFFDWNQGSALGERDARTELGQNNIKFGVQAVEGWNPRFGLQTDHLSYASRPIQTRYDFERATGWDGGWLAVKMTDTFSVYAKPGRTVANATAPDFQVDLLAGRVVEPARDMLRSFTFRFGNVQEEIGASLSQPEIERTFRIRDIFQKPDATNPGGKSPFAILTMTAKTTLDPNDYAMPWLHNHPVTMGAAQDTRVVGNALDTYDLRLEELSDFNNTPGVAIDGKKRGFHGARATIEEGVTNVPMFRVPLIPATSLGDLIGANLAPSAALPRVTHPFGNSNAHPLIPAASVATRSPVTSGDTGGGNMLDHSYLLNDALWDRYFFSTIASYGGGMVGSENRSGLLSGFFTGSRQLLNPRFTPMSIGEGSLEDQAGELDSLGDMDFARRIGGHIAVRGPFNVNSDSVEAWRAVLSSLRDKQVLGWQGTDLTVGEKTAFARMSLPLAGDADDAGNLALDIAGEVRWAGFRALDDDQIETLAKAIVEEIRARGAEDNAPSLSLAEFVNRRVASAGSLHAIRGILATAIEKSGINEAYHSLDSKTIGGNEAASSQALTGLAEPQARAGYTAEGSPPMITQGDLLMALAPVITVRGDTFRIRAYGESRDGSAATANVTARAWCEAVVQRIPEYLDPADEVHVETSQLKSEVNRNFGRRMMVVSFRWLSPEEI